MFRFFPIMFASGRVFYNRMLVTVMDVLVIYAMYFSFTGGMHWAIGILFAMVLVLFYIRVSYYHYFRIIKKHQIIKTSIGFDNGFIAFNIIVRAVSAEGDQMTISLPVKVAMGRVYQRYVLYVYMSLCNALVLYARKRQKQVADK